MNKNKEIKKLSKFVVATALAIGGNTLIVTNVKADASNRATALNQSSSQISTQATATTSDSTSSSNLATDSSVSETIDAAKASSISSSQSSTTEASSASLQKATASTAQSLTNKATNQNVSSEAQSSNANNQVETNQVSQSDSNTQKIEVNSGKHIAAAQSKTAANKTEVADEQKTVDTLKSQIDDLNQKINNASDTNNNNLITVPSDYASALNSYIDSVVNGDSDSGESLVKLAAEGLSENSYQDNVADEKISVIPGNLSDSQIEELSNYAASLINDIRQQLGTTPNVSVVKGAVSFAKAVADNYTSDNWNIYTYKDHDDSAINQAALANGLATYDGSNVYEDASAGYLINNVTGQKLTNSFTLNDYKKAIYNTLIAMLFDDANENWLHAMSITNLNDYAGTDNYGTEKSAQYFAVSVDDLGQLHFEFISEWQIIDLSKFDTSSSVSKLKDQLVSSKTALATAENALAIAQSKLVTVENTTKLLPKNVSERTYKQIKDSRVNQQLIANGKADNLKSNKAMISIVKFISHRGKKQPIINKSRQFSTNLPQTDENDSSALTLFGLLLIEMTGLIGIIGKLRKISFK
ncbi:SEC10/PgrA surface exclusion domain-containing protein [Liquorilactobacillus sicerae]|uniref:SEC10/PgrA surface exclusion domain-containing protein n=1 Tax=Liquorilactobacillus sicerae TaxID=1416943 RepID=UPI00248011A3|nr:SEC10/PgrA surface exclusion domain-containing protein [Liquorilactobacillus sicerae]